MGDKSNIEWTDATWNPVTGCTKVSDGCKHCYAERLFPRVYGRDEVSRLSSERPGGDATTRPRRFTDIRLHPERLYQPLRWRRPRLIFVNSMSDLFHEDVPFRFIDKVFAIMAMVGGHGRDEPHTLQILTKRPERMIEYLRMPTRHDRVFDAIKGFAAASNENERAGCRLRYGQQRFFPLPNVWLGVSVENQETADERIPLLLQTPAAVRFVSYEPALGQVRLGPGQPGESWLTWLPHGSDSPDLPDIAIREQGIDWVIAGGESGPNARPSHPDWFRSVRDQCQAAGVPFFFKQWGQWLPEEQQNARGVLCESAYVINDDEFSGPVHFWDSNLASVRVPKKEAGRLLDGKLHDEYPK